VRSEPQYQYNYECVDSAPTPKLSQDLGYGVAASATYVITSDFTAIRRTPLMSANTLLLGNTTLGIPTRIFNSKPSSASSTWLQELRLSWDMKQSSEIMEARRTGSSNVDATVKIQQQCSADDCSGCTVSAVQRACFAMQQCAVTKCIGTVVNLERPMCSVGRLLQAGLDTDLAKMHGIWTVMTDMVSFIIAAASGVKIDSMKLEFIDEIFFSLICEAKHGIVASMAIITSLINGIINSADRSRRMQNYRTSHSEDQEAENAEAVRTMTAAATTNFLSQIALGVLYPIIITKKTMMCHTDAFLSIFDVSGFELRLSSGNFDKQEAALVGQCLSEYHTESMQNPDSAESQQSLMSVMERLAVDAGTAVAQIPFEDFIHVMDGFFSYAIGVVSGLQDVIATADQKHCNLPDSEADQVGTCSCGDVPVEIPSDRAAEGMKEGAFWCSGMLTLISPMGETYIAYNPYTYAEIVERLRDNAQPGRGHDKYLTCISQGVSGDAGDVNCVDYMPTLEKLEMQGISLMTVLTRCKSNYANSQWDDAAASLFSDQTMSRFVVAAGQLADEANEMRKLVEVSLGPAMVECMRTSLERNSGNDACLADWLTVRKLRRQVFFQYQAITAPAYGQEVIAACRVFTGPAADNIPAFMRCLDEYEDTGCTMGGMVWAGRSANRVPVATTHALVQEDPANRYAAARLEHARIRESVLAIIGSPAIQNWDAKHLDLAIFTAEGDSLHQLFDALVLGPYARANMWPMDVEQTFTRFDWFRDDSTGETREFQLPCTGDALRNVTSSPFTCGSATRRSVIRYSTAAPNPPQTNPIDLNPP
jgi:hypothetical protein